MGFDILYNDINEKFLQKAADVNSDDRGDVSFLDNNLQSLESMQIVFKLTDITVLQYLMIASIKRLETELEIDYGDPRFIDLNSGDDSLDDMYVDLVEDVKMFMNKIKDDSKGINGVTEDFARYVSTTGQLCNVTIHTNGKKFLKLLATFIKYDELSSIVEVMVDRDTEGELIANSLYLSTAVSAFEIYLRKLVDPVTRGELIDDTDADGVGVIFESNLKGLSKAKRNGVDIGKITTTSYVTSSLLAYQELIKHGYSDRIRMENLYHVLTTDRESTINLALPHQLYTLPYINDMMDMIMKWCELLERCMENEVFVNKNALNLIPNALTVTYRYISKIENDSNVTIDMQGFEEVANIQFSRKNMLVNALTDLI